MTAFNFSIVNGGVLLKPYERIFMTLSGPSGAEAVALTGSFVQNPGWFNTTGEHLNCNYDFAWKQPYLQQLFYARFMANANVQIPPPQAAVGGGSFIFPEPVVSGRIL